MMRIAVKRIRVIINKFVLFANTLSPRSNAGFFIIATNPIFLMSSAYKPH